MAANSEIQLSAGTIAYEDTGGSGPVILFVHGLLANGMLWAPVVQQLAPHARCVVPELPLGAHATPMKPDADLSPRSVAALIAELMEKLELRDVTLVGNDTGGAICQLLVTEHPERVARLVLTPCDAFEHFFPPAFRPMQWAAKVPGMLAASLRPVKIRAFRESPLGFGWLSKRGIPDEAMESAFGNYFGNKAVQRDTEKFVRQVSKKDTLAAAERLRDFDRPVLLAWAREDKFFKVKLAERLLDRLPNGRLELIDDSYTFVSIDQPERLAQLIREFVLDGAQTYSPA
ncbi:MAG TPA: alpha/beta hydrolase [Thermoleophilaceae bacterium]|nr:alpha/beta hydrolase [Thermoleophilaceae bacterium]